MSSRASNSCFAIEKMVVFAPIARASETVTRKVNPGLLRNRRPANTRSCGSSARIHVIYPKTVIAPRRKAESDSCWRVWPIAIPGGGSRAVWLRRLRDQAQRIQFAQPVRPLVPTRENAANNDAHVHADPDRARRRSSGARASASTAVRDFAQAAEVRHANRRGSASS